MEDNFTRVVNYVMHKAGQNFTLEDQYEELERVDFVAIA